MRLASDDRLVALARAGDERAFATIYDRHQRGLLGFCRHMLGSREEAEDALQQTFLSAHRALARTDEPIALRAWLYAIARNRCISMLRARRDEVSAESAPEPSVEGLADEVQHREDLRALLRDLDDLPDDQRAALVLAELGDLSHEEIAQVIGVPKSKVKALVFQARESLIATRRARDMPCTEIRVQLATLRGGALRRTDLRRHLNGCPGCRAYREDVRRQRAALALVLPVLPSAGLKETVLAAALGGGGAAGGGAAIGGSLAGGAALLKGTAAKVAIGVVALGSTVTGGVVGVEQISGPPSAPATKAPETIAARPAAAPATGAAVRARRTATSTAPATGSQRATAERRRARHKRSRRSAGASTPSAAAPAVAPASSAQPMPQQNVITPKKVKKGKKVKPAKPKAVKVHKPKPPEPKNVKGPKAEAAPKPEKVPSSEATGGAPAPPTTSVQTDRPGRGTGNGEATGKQDSSG